MREAVCKDCKNPFRSSAYWYLMKKSDFPESCFNCRLANREKLRAQLEGRLQKIESEYILEVKTGGKGPKGFGKKKKILVTSETKKEESKSMRFKDFF